MTKSNEQFTKIATDLLVGVRDLANWGIDTGNTTPDKLRLTVAARADTAQKLLESGMSQREVAKVLGVTKSTITRDVGRKGPKNGPKRPKKPTPDPIHDMIDDDDACDAPLETGEEKGVRLRKAFLWRAQEAIRFGELDDLGEVEINQDVLNAATNVVMTWKKIAAFIKERLE